jgi:dTDP-4-amino-4,6-dideoxygalactose transaminase
MSEKEPFVALCEPALRGNVRAYLEECVATNFVSSVGAFVERFEKEFAAYVGAKYAVACASGTAALHVAMRLCGVEPGDDVLVPTLTFIASANPAVYERARVVLCDSERETWNMDQALACEEIERRARTGEKQIKLVEAVHLLGHPARIDELVATCAKHGVHLIEDASEALGARWTEGAYAGRHIGTVAKLGCFSFNGNKIITTGGGGMITTDDPALAKRAKHLTTQARLPGPEYRHDEVGYNYRLTNLAAALGVAQLEELPAFVKDKHRIAAKYDAAIQGIAGLSAPPRARWADPSMWLYTMLIDQAVYGRDRVAQLERFQARNIQTRPIWSPLHMMPMYRDSPRIGGAVADDIFARGLSLPCSVGLSDESQARVIELLR